MYAQAIAKTASTRLEVLKANGTERANLRLVTTEKHIYTGSQLCGPDGSEKRSLLTRSSDMIHKDGKGLQVAVAQYEYNKRDHQS